MEKEIKEEKILVLRRIPPGDRWQFINTKQDSSIHNSLTDGLEAWFQANGDTKFYMDARKGTVEIVMEQEVVIPQKRFSLYGED